jgi:hypothetical protein
MISIVAAAPIASWLKALISNAQDGADDKTPPSIGASDVLVAPGADLGFAPDSGRPAGF